MSNSYRDFLNIRYVKLHFELVFPKDCILPENKTSALRGGIGEMLLRANCIRDRKCEVCDFESECIVQRTMYSKFENKPDFMNGKDSVGYVIECENYSEHFAAGDSLEFALILFGKTICYLNQYLTAVYSLGDCGIGKDNARYVVGKVTNTKKETLLQDGSIYMERYEILTLNDYVDFRLKQIGEKGLNNVIVFKTAASIKYNLEFIEQFSSEAFLKSLQRRIYILDCFEGIDGKDFYETELPKLELLEQSSKPIVMKRYSNRTGQHSAFKGIKGTMTLKEIPEELLPLILAGEILHIGKNTSFGFGRYKLH